MSTRRRVFAACSCRSSGPGWRGAPGRASIDEALAAQGAGLIGFLQCGLNRLFVFACADDGQRCIERDGSFLDGHQQALFTLLQQCQHALDILESQPGLCGDLLGGVAGITQLLDARQQFQWTPLAPRNVLGQAHDEGVFVTRHDHQRWDGSFTQGLERLQPALATDQQVVLGAVVQRPWRYHDWLLQADGLDVGDDFAEGSAVTFPRVQHLDLVDRQRTYLADGQVGSHAATLSLALAAMP